MPPRQASALLVEPVTCVIFLHAGPGSCVLHAALWSRLHIPPLCSAEVARTCSAYPIYSSLLAAQVAEIGSSPQDYACLRRRHILWWWPCSCSSIGTTTMSGVGSTQIYAAGGIRGGSADQAPWAPMGGRLGKAWPVVSTSFTTLELAKVTSGLTMIHKATYQRDAGRSTITRRTEQSISSVLFCNITR
ncbi:hypothetical protein POSPLADRAFT_1137644 [Postia placenta MAD-698-R-SB12]|uniref:Uncharacterized protein n=1 Tax=Postia placenta MAD-698-R-SB12 TaxID=670580 RepID=A0A1X6N5N3_9APHY|nr:hypothetical protein POSPLADRAFT_1137644 [Postia placenta MAD-698-R-SB12]OSX63914.1 hypothetical protein POSPLADRAFT_1137644 [Postia placenta MAD-698-R-SB12]